MSLPLHSVSCSQSCVHGGRDYSLVEGILIAVFLHEDLPKSPYIGDYKSIQNKEGKKGRKIKGSEGRSFRMPHKDQIRAEKFKMSVWLLHSICKKGKQLSRSQYLSQDPESSWLCHLLLSFPYAAQNSLELQICYLNLPSTGIIRLYCHAHFTTWGWLVANFLGVITGRP